MFRPEMLLPMGLPREVSVIAWGVSLERYVCTCMCDFNVVWNTGFSVFKTDFTMCSCIQYIIKSHILYNDYVGLFAIIILTVYSW